MRTPISLVTLATVSILAIAASPAATADAQSWGDRLKKKAEEAAKRKVEERTEKRAGQAADKALDQVECAATDQACIDKKAAAGQGGASGAVTSAGAAGGAAAASLRPGEGAWANYDFKPGDRVILAEDFSKDEVGAFPRRFAFKSGQIEIVEWNGGRWLRSPNVGLFYIPLPEALPEQFTMEFDVAGGGNAMIITFDGQPSYATRYVGVGAAFANLRSDDITADGRLGLDTQNGPVRISLTVDGGHARLYAGERRVFNAPNVNLGRSKRIMIQLNGWSDEHPRLIANLRIASGGKKLYEALAASGRVATQGIYFDTGSDRIRPESTPTLKEMGQMLTDHPELNLTIEGHTDNVGSETANRELSQRRAAAVKAYLVDRHGIDGARLSSAGFGDTKPAAPNTTPEGRQQNRRVELVKR